MGIIELSLKRRVTVAMAAVPQKVVLTIECKTLSIPIILADLERSYREHEAKRE